MGGPVVARTAFFLMHARLTETGPGLAASMQRPQIQRCTPYCIVLESISSTKYAEAKWLLPVQEYPAINNACKRPGHRRRPPNTNISSFQINGRPIVSSIPRHCTRHLDLTQSRGTRQRQSGTMCGGK